MPKISIVSPCYNEEENVEELCRQVREVFQAFPSYDYEHLFIDNASVDRTVPILKALLPDNPQIKIIVNARNFGHIKSPYYGMLQADGDAIVLLASDLQDPPELIRDFITHWERGYKVVLGVKTQSRETPAMFLVRKMYYEFIGRLSSIELTKNNTGFGLYDRRVIEILRELDDPYPYFRGMISEIGFESAKVEYTQPARVRGITKNNFYTLYDLAMLGITNHSKVPLRIAAMLGFLVSIVSMVVAVGYFVAKLVWWNTFSMGIAPLIIGLFFFSAVQLFFIGIIGEYIGSIHTQVLRRPLVVEKERINF